MHVVIVGAGEVGTYLARFLVSEKHDVTVLDLSAEKVQAIEEFVDLKTVVGSGTCVATLEAAETGKTDLLLAMTDSDEANLLTAYLGKCLGARRTIARVASPDVIAGHPSFYRKHLGLDLVINQARLAAAEATTVIQAGGGAGIAEFGFGRIYLRPFLVEAGSPYTRKQISRLHLPGALIVALIRDELVLIPGGGDTLNAGDRLFVICKPEAVPYVQKGVGESADKVRHIMIVGGGNIGAAIAHYFDSPRYRVKLFEDDRRRAWELADELKHVKVIDSDGADLRVLEQEYIETTEAFVTATGSDEKNLMTAVLAKEHGVSRTVALVDKPQFAELGKKLGLTATLAPRILAANQILAFISGGSVNRVSLLAEGQAEVVEFQATEHSRVIDQPLAELGLPKGIIIAGLVHGSKAIIPKGDDVIRAGDTVVLFAIAERIPYVEGLLRAEQPGDSKQDAEAGQAR